MEDAKEQPDREALLRRTRKLLVSLGMPDEDVPDDKNADVWELQERVRKLEQLRARQFSTAFKSERG